MTKLVLPLICLLFVAALDGQTPSPIKGPAPDERFKTDILLVVAHPDDDTLVASYDTRFMDAFGPRYALTDVSRAQGTSYAVLAAREARHYSSQLGYPELRDERIPAVNRSGLSRSASNCAGEGCLSRPSQLGSFRPPLTYCYHIGDVPHSYAYRI